MDIPAKKVARHEVPIGAGGIRYGGHCEIGFGFAFPRRPRVGKKRGSWITGTRSPSKFRRGVEGIASEIR